MDSGIATIIGALIGVGATIGGGYLATKWSAGIAARQEFRRIISDLRATLEFDTTVNRVGEFVRASKKTLCSALHLVWPHIRCDQRNRHEEIWSEYKRIDPEKLWDDEMTTAQSEALLDEKPFVTPAQYVDAYLEQFTKAVG